MEYEIPEVIPPDLERPNSHDVYLVDYRIWGVMQDLDVTDPRHHLIDTFCETQVRTDGEDELDIFFRLCNGNVYGWQSTCFTQVV